MLAHDVYLQRHRRAFSLLELVSVVLILGLLAAVVLSGFSGPSDTAKQNACYINKGEIELQAQLWFRHKAVWPAGDLSDVGSDPSYFPEGLPICPVDGTSYTFDPATQRAVGHTH